MNPKIIKICIIFNYSKIDKKFVKKRNDSKIINKYFNLHYIIE